MSQMLVEVENVRKTFKLRRTRILTKPEELVALRNVSFNVGSGEVLGIVGESGSGKSTLARLVVGLDRPDQGRIQVAGVDVPNMTVDQERSFRKTVQIVFQDPFSSLDPRMKIRAALTEPLKALEIGGSRKARVNEVLDAVQLPQDSADKYPHEFSGGQRQRIAIARALVSEPTILVADEPVSALDLSVQAQILNLLLDLRDGFGLTLIIIAHDLGVIRHMADRVLVMRSGDIVETGPTELVFSDPRHPYTELLLSAIIGVEGVLEPMRWEVEGGTPQQGCLFADRCPYRKRVCWEESPELDTWKGADLGREAACHFRDEPKDHDKASSPGNAAPASQSPHSRVGRS